MYEAKESGRNRVVVYRPRRRRAGAWSSAIRRGRSGSAARCDEDRFELYCQPILDLATDDVSPVRAPAAAAGRRRRAAPARRVPARRRALRPDPGDRRLGGAPGRRADRRARARRARADPRREPVRQVDRRSTASRRSSRTPSPRHAIDPARLVFELTETAAIANIERGEAASPRASARLGCQFALDDFGSGFSSFFYLKNLPFDYIKIDGDFVRGLDRSPTDQLIVQAIVAIAGGMGKTDRGRVRHRRRDAADRSSEPASTTRRATTSAAPARVHEVLGLAG